MVLQAGFRASLPNLFRRLQVDSVNAFGLTMREADSWESVRLMDVILDLASFRQTCVISARPGSAYAGRWAQGKFSSFVVFRVQQCYRVVR
jgi:hypothetical protein